jgi:predicted RNase H-like nuclease (RuvC/YqgF family)
MKTVTELEKEIQKTRHRLNKLQSQLRKVQYRTPTKSETEARRIRKLELELRRKYPNAQVDRSILKLVGTLPRRGSDQRLMAEAIAEKYGK